MKFGNMVIKKHPYLDLLISNNGWVYVPKRRFNPPKWTKGCVSKSTGYCQLYHNQKCLLVHRLMAETFIKNPNKYEEVDHIDRNRSNNVIENLRWASKKMNRDNQENVIECLKKYGVRCCDDVKGYDKARYKILKQDKNWVIEKRKKANDYAAKNRDKINERQRNRRTRLHEETNAYERNRYKKNIEFERKRQRMYSERMKNEGKVRVLINGHRKWIDKNIADKFKEVK